MKKRIIGILLCICMLAALLPLQAAAEGEAVEFVRTNFGADYTFKSGKIYRICLNDDDSAITVEKGATLTVEPGAIIEFGVNGNVHDSEGKNTGDRLYVRGTLKLLGTAEKPIIVRPQYGGDWANCTGIVLERDETGGKVCLEASYTSFTGGGMEGRMWEGGIISIHGWGDMEQSYSLKLDHCSLQGSSHPWEYPDIYNSPDGTYALGFHPESYAAAIFVSAERNPVDVQLNDCTFGAEDLPIGKAIQDSGYTRDPALHDWKITNCTFTNTKKPDGSDRGSIGVVNISCPRDLTITGCTFEPSEALPTPLYFNNNVRFRAKAGMRVIKNNEICYTANEQTFYGTNYGVGYTNMPLCLSGMPLKELNVQEGQLVIPDIGGEGMWSYAGFNLCIADGGRLNVAPDATISLDGSANRYYRMELGKDAAVNGLELYGVDGVTPISYPTAEPMSFVYLSPSYNDEPYSGLPTGKWVRVTEAHTPVTGVEIFEGEEVWLTSGADTPSLLHAFALPEDAYDTAAFWITTNDISSDALQCNKEAVYDSNRKCYLPTVVKVSYSKSKPTDETLCAYSRDGALIDTILVHFRSSDDPEMTSVTGVSLPTDVTLQAGQSLKLPMSVLPEDATTKNVWWESGDERYVTVDQNGVITALKEGTAIISVTTLDNPTTAKCTVTVTKGEEPPETCTHANTEIRNAAEPTCTEPGYTGDTYCVDCGAKLAAGEAIAALGHDWDEPDYIWGVDYSECTAYRVCKRDQSHVESETVKTTSKVTKEATYEAEGEIVYTASFTNAAFKTQTAAVATPKLTNPSQTNPFKDVKEGDFYYDAVLWAVNAQPQVTSGTSATTFSPNDTCTRAQVVTFLWRAKGCPEPKSTNNPFGDVKAGEYYYKAVLWAVENNITAGTSATTFSPNAGCTRAQVVTFLWRTEGQPKPTSSANPFGDVKGGYYYDAVLWAVDKGITAGTSKTTFSPDNTCTRGQIVTFLYRAFAA